MTAAKEKKGVEPDAPVLDIAPPQADASMAGVQGADDPVYATAPKSDTTEAPLRVAPEAPPSSGSYTAKARSFSRFRLAANLDEAAGVTKVIVHVNTIKPSPQAWFRVHPDESYRLPVALLNLKEENEVFIVDPGLVPELAAEVVPHLLFTYITRQDVVGIWPVRLPRSDGRTDGWMRSSHEAAELAMTRWVRMQASRSAGAYDVSVSKAQLPDPEWPDISFEKLLEIGFADHVVESMDHPVLRRLRGEV